MMPVFPFNTLLLLVIPVALAAGILAAMSKRETGVFKKQGVAWGLTVLMIFAAIGIGYAKAPINSPKPEPPNAPAGDTVPPASADFYVRDDAGVLSDKTVRALNERNGRLWEKHKVTIGVLTCNYGRDDLGDYAAKRAAEMGLGGYDFIVALDISGDSYWLVQGADIRRDFSDQTCSDYAYDYMEDYFVRGMYDEAVLDLTEALEGWYGTYYF